MCMVSLSQRDLLQPAHLIFISYFSWAEVQITFLILFTSNPNDMLAFGINCLDHYNIYAHSFRTSKTDFFCP